MSKSPRLKDQVRFRLRIVGTAYAVLIAWIALGTPKSIASLAAIELPQWLFSLLPSLGLVLIGWLDRLGPPSLKEAIVFWRVRERLPGHRAFEASVLRTDARIDLKKLKAKLGRFPVVGMQQNATWFGLYKKYEADPSVLSVHFDYLMFRELAWLMAIGTILTFVLAGMISEQQDALLGAAAISGIVTVFTTLVARNSANRFVATVLALESVSV